MARYQSSSSSSSSDEEDALFLRREKIYKPRINHFTQYDDIEFFERFRLTKPTFMHLLHSIADNIRLPTNR